MRARAGRSGGVGPKVAPSRTKRANIARDTASGCKFLSRASNSDVDRPASKREAARRANTIDRLPPADVVLREFISDFSAASALMRQLRRRLADALDLSIAGHSVMLGLWYCQRQGSTSVRDLAEHLHVAAAHVTAELVKLERAGFVVKRPSSSDRRAVNVELSAKGLTLLDRLSPLLQDVNRVLFANVRYDDMLTVQRFFVRIIAQASEAIHTADIHSMRNQPKRRKRAHS